MEDSHSSRLGATEEIVEIRAKQDRALLCVLGIFAVEVCSNANMRQTRNWMSMDEQFLRQATDVEEAAALTAQLVGIRSCPGGEGDVQRAIATWLRANGVDAELRQV